MTVRNAGFSLVEVVVASFLVSLALAGTLVAMSSLARMARMADEVNRQTHMARQVVEELRTFTFAEPALAVGTTSLTNGFYEVSVATTNVLRVKVTQYAVVRGRTTQVEITTLFCSMLRN